MLQVIVSNAKEKKVPLSKIQEELFDKSLKEIIEEKYGKDAVAKIEGENLVITTGKQELYEINEEELIENSIKQILKKRGVKIGRGTRIKIKK